jgi:hypothetical protein
MNLHRRDIMEAAAAILAGFLAGPALAATESTAAGPVTPARVSALMQRLTGFALLDDTFADYALSTLDEVAKARLAAVLDETDPVRITQQLGSLATDLLRLSYTSKDSTGAYLDIQQAVAWQAAGIKPLTQCDPQGFGGWSRAPGVEATDTGAGK